MDTKQKILDAAEQLIAAQGFAGTSLRQIIAAAGVNLAAVHYHFGSKEDLLDQVISRKATSVNEERLRLLEAFENEVAGAPVAVDKVLAAFFRPMIAAGSRNPQFVRLMGRMYGEGLLPALLEKHFQPTIARFVNALQRSLPEVPLDELFWRVRFMVGAMSQAVCGWEFPFAGQSERGKTDACGVMSYLQTFLCAGFQALPTREVS